jgi:hypothetical protein
MLSSVGNQAILLTISAALSLAACSQPPGNSQGAAQECVEPSNPWAGDDRGHDAGFRWAQETGGQCGSSNSMSFDEGCSEYYRQQSDYEACVATNNK